MKYVKRHQIDSPTMADVAQAAGVSVMTVSRAFSDPATVTEETRRKIAAAASKLSYVPDRMAGALKSGVSNIVAAVVPSLRNAIFAGTLQGLADGLSARGLVLTVGDGRYSLNEEQRVVLEFLTLKPRALVLHETVHTAETKRMLKRAKVPVIEVGDLPRAAIDFAVSFSNEAAAHAMTQHLLQRGYRRVAILTVPTSRSNRSRARLQGYRTSLERAGIDYDPALVVEVESGYEAAAKGLAQLIERRVGMDAVFGAGDVFALGAFLEAKRRGLRIPEDLAIASFDDHEMCRVTDPAITSLAIPRYEIGRRCAEIVGAEQTRVDSNIERVYDLAFSLNARAST